MYGRRKPDRPLVSRRRRRGWLNPWLVTGVAVALVVCAVPAHAEKRVALVIGNNDYRNVPKLQKAVNDARAMGDASGSFTSPGSNSSAWCAATAARPVCRGISAILTC